jgi:hypothetical protein
MDSIKQLPYQDKMSIVRQRYKSTKDLWLYMTERRKLNLHTSSTFMLHSAILDAFTEELPAAAPLRCLV